MGSLIKPVGLVGGYPFTVRITWSKEGAWEGVEHIYFSRLYSSRQCETEDKGFLVGMPSQIDYHFNRSQTLSFQHIFLCHGGGSGHAGYFHKPWEEFVHPASPDFINGKCILEATVKFMVKDEL